MELVTIQLTNDEATLFRKFREHQDKFNTLLSNGVFNTRNGQCILNFDSVGTLTQIDVNVVLYKKGLPVIHIWNTI